MSQNKPRDLPRSNREQAGVTTSNLREALRPKAPASAPAQKPADKTK
jgi:hypothetical protein